MTENDARQKWCPYSGKTPTAYGDEALLGSFCIASDCMAWRWWGVDMDAPAPRPEELDGYCGLAGVPHGGP